MHINSNLQELLLYKYNSYFQGINANGQRKEIVLKSDESGDEVYTPSYCVTVTAGFLIDEGYFNSGDLDEENGEPDLINDVTSTSMRNDTVIVYRMNNRIYSIMDCIASNGEDCS